ncbi:unnamed protein product [Paramecium primaurelia]|uniref:Uncharacterized protein n=1 Tax=Paramecium primaurelia TaxID=5886 RepID=A0A8S1QHS1_PARPR|nr:unnamed protein product [Paramecium primaurelia]
MHKMLFYLLSFGCKAPVNFEISIAEITENSITVEITKDFTNLIQVGYQILVGIDEAFPYQKMQYPIGPTAYHISNLNLIEGNSYQFLSTYYGFQYTPVNKFHLVKETTQTYSDQTFDYSIFHYVPAVFSPCASLEFFVKKQYITIFTPIRLKSVIITQKDDPNSINNTLIIVNLEFQNQIIMQSGKYKIMLDKSILQININILINCKNITKIESVFRKQKKNIQNVNKMTYECGQKFNSIIFNLTFAQTIVAYQELYLQIEEFSLNLQQLLYNQKEELIELFNMKLE